jgi:hypothetical protein
MYFILRKKSKQAANTCLLMVEELTVLRGKYGLGLLYVCPEDRNISMVHKLP